MTAPRVTVIIPTYNRARWLGTSIAAVLAQSFHDFELVVCDNASTDETPQVIAAFSDPRLRVERRDRNVGLVENHNLAMAAVRTEYCLIVPDDDVVGPGLLRTTVAALDRSPGAGMVHTNFDMVGPEGAVLAGDVNWTHGLDRSVVERGGDFIRESMRWSCRVCASTALMRTAAIPDGRFHVEDFPAVDFGMWLRMARRWDMAFVAENHAQYRIHGASHSSAFGATTEAGYVQGVELVTRLRAVKERFLAQGEGLPVDAGTLRRVADRGRRWELLMLARNLTLPERHLVPTLRAVSGAALVDPRVLADVGMWRLVVGSVIGRRAVDRLRRGGTGPVPGAATP